MERVIGVLMLRAALPGGKGIVMHRPRVSGRARAALSWSVLAFVVIQLAFTVVVDGWFPFFYDPEAQERLQELRNCLTAEPDRPLLLMVGSSRTAMAFHPEIVGPLRQGPGPQPLVYNYSHLGAPASFNLIQLQRLLKQGIRPRWLVVEMMPPLLCREYDVAVIKLVVGPELPGLLQYFPVSKLFGCYAVNRLVPWYRYRSLLLQQLAPAWVDPAQQGIQMPLGKFGWESRSWHGDLNARELLRRTGIARGDYLDLLQHYHIKDRLARPLEDLLALCAREHIEAAVVLAPESHEFRSWYSPDAEEKIQTFCARLVRNYGVAIIDARDWLPDEEFLDGHHVLPQGADTFTRRLEREVLQPLVTEGRTGPKSELGPCSRRNSVTPPGIVGRASGVDNRLNPSR